MRSYRETSGVFSLMLVVCIFLSMAMGFNVNVNSRASGSDGQRQGTNGRGHTLVRGERWGRFQGKDVNFEDVNSQRERWQFLGQSKLMERQLGRQSEVFNSLGDLHQELGSREPEEGKEARLEYNLNKGRALETLRRELPLVFFTKNLDFSIFAQEILVNDGKNRFAMPHNVYITVVKSLKLASTFSTMYPSMNVRKVEYLEDCSTIQCLVDVVLPDSIRIDGASVWEGMFYFGLNSRGLISSHTFDRKISNKTPSRVNSKSFPWLSSQPQWSPELLVGAARFEENLDESE